jgi:hypothetical protein
MLCVALGGALLVVFTGSAAAATPRAYKQRLNTICRSYTPAIRKLELDATRAQKRGDQHRWGRDVGKLVGISLLESDRILRTPVPAALRAEMATPLRLVRATNAQGKKLLNSAHTTKAVFAALDALDRLSVRANRALDAVGLRDCGSNQQ